ncbi:MAG: hypothetical protein MK207_15000 [Saprospiraceae bacterium]|nr:hypothetical protein [Saprospiraceae bacterium]
MSEKLDKLQDDLQVMKSQLDRYLKLFQADGYITPKEMERLIEMQNYVETIEYKIAEINIKNPSNKLLSEEETEKAIQVNSKHKADTWKLIGDVLGVPGILDATLVQALAKFQKAKGLEIDGMVGDYTFQWLSLHPSGKGKALGKLVKSEHVMYLGMRGVSRKREAAVVTQTVGSKNATIIEGSVEENKIDVEGELVDLETSDGLDAFLDSLVNVNEAEKVILKEVIENIRNNARDEVCNFVRQMNEAENGKKLFKRLVLSGHSDGWYIVGDDNEGSYTFKDIANIGKVFSNAFKQVEDLQIAGCNTGQEAKLDQHLKMFPNLKTIWAYADFSPSPDTGSKYHIKKWLKGTEGRGDAKIDAARKDVSNDGGSKDKNIATYKVDSDEYKTDHSMSGWDLQRVSDELWPVEHYYTEAFFYGKINKAGLRDLQSLLQNFTGRPEAKSHYNFQKYLKMNTHVLLLRHWPQYNHHFMQNHGTDVNKGYNEIGREVPNFEKMTRKETLDEIKQFQPKGEDSEATKSLLVDILEKLNGDSTWI